MAARAVLSADAGLLVVFPMVANPENNPRVQTLIHIATKIKSFVH